mmetsp:Transcript_27484/g.77748  ORF Transcript_27484/g.77748 Transcript_27484/m.77748 type:complete len:313 (-) Transcript_27484:1215-2153(-)
MRAVCWSTNPGSTTSRLLDSALANNSNDALDPMSLLMTLCDRCATIEAVYHSRGVRPVASSLPVAWPCGTSSSSTAEVAPAFAARCRGSAPLAATRPVSARTARSSRTMCSWSGLWGRPPNRPEVLGLVCCAAMCRAVCPAGVLASRADRCASLSSFCRCSRRPASANFAWYSAALCRAVAPAPSGRVSAVKSAPLASAAPKRVVSISDLAVRCISVDSASVTATCNGVSPWESGADIDALCSNNATTQACLVRDTARCSGGFIWTWRPCAPSPSPGRLQASSRRWNRCCVRWLRPAARSLRRAGAWPRSTA